MVNINFYAVFNEFITFAEHNMIVSGIILLFVILGVLLIPLVFYAKSKMFCTGTPVRGGCGTKLGTHYYRISIDNTPLYYVCENCLKKDLELFESEEEYQEYLQEKFNATMEKVN